jgi:hypothetical protein
MTLNKVNFIMGQYEIGIARQHIVKSRPRRIKNKSSQSVCTDLSSQTDGQT